MLESVAASGRDDAGRFLHAPAVRLLRPAAAAGGICCGRRRRCRRADATRCRTCGAILSDQEQAACERLFALVRRKDDLDFHEARQRLLKLWLFVHIGLTYALVLLALLHGLLAHAFRGGAA